MKSKTVIYFQVVHLKKSYKTTPAGVPKSHFSLFSNVHKITFYLLLIVLPVYASSQPLTTRILFHIFFQVIESAQANKISLNCYLVFYNSEESSFTHFNSNQDKVI